MNQYEYVDGENMKNGLDGGLSEFEWLVAVATQQNKYVILFSFTRPSWTSTANDVSDDEGQRLFAAFQLFCKQQKGIHQKATTSVPLKTIVEEDSEGEPRT